MSFIHELLDWFARASYNVRRNPAEPVTYIGRAYQVELADGTRHDIAGALGITESGLVCAPSRGELARGNFNPVRNPVRARTIWYERKRPEGRFWFHDLDNAVVDLDSFGVASASSFVCPSPPGDFICEV